MSCVHGALQTRVVLSVGSVVTVPRLGHGGISRADCPRRRQLSDHPGAAAHGCDAGPGSDAAPAAVQAAGGQHDAQRHPERPHLRCARTQVRDVSSYHNSLGTSGQWTARGVSVKFRTNKESRNVPYSNHNHAVFS